MWKQILKTGFIAGLLDITAACLQAYLLRGTTPPTILQYIASGVWGKAAFNGSAAMMAAGLFFHFTIAFACTIAFFWLYPQLKGLQKSRVANSFLIAIVAWVVTTRLLIPLSKISPAPFNLKNAAMAIAILFVCIGLPIAFSAARFYKKK
jgi:hypothetical protein